MPRSHHCGAHVILASLCAALLIGGCGMLGSLRHLRADLIAPGGVLLQAQISGLSHQDLIYRLALHGPQSRLRQHLNRHGWRLDRSAGAAEEAQIYRRACFDGIIYEVALVHWDSEIVTISTLRCVARVGCW